MVKHIVFWNLKPECKTRDTMEKMRELLTQLVGKIPGLLHAEVGFNYNPNGFDVALYTEFESTAAQDNYQTHPEHIKVKEFIHTVIQNRAVVDYEI